MRAGREEVRDLAEDPRAALRGAADHHARRRRCAAARRAPSPAWRCRRWRSPGCAPPRLTAAIVSYSTVADERARARAAVHGRAPACRRPRRCARSRRVARVRMRAGADLERDRHVDRARRPPRGSRATSGSSASSAEPAAALHTFFAGQPMLMSMICAPRVDVVARGLRHQRADRRRRSARRSGATSPAWSMRRRDLVGAPQPRIGRDHLGHRVARAQPLAQRAERAVGDARPSARRRGCSAKDEARCARSKTGWEVTVESAVERTVRLYRLSARVACAAAQKSGSGATVLRARTMRAARASERVFRTSRTASRA